MTEQAKSPEELFAEFQKNMHELFNKHAGVMIAADELLVKAEWEQFKTHYANLSQELLAEIVQAQHVKANEMYDVIKQRTDFAMDVLRDISNCKDFMAFDDLRKKARSILLAQDMVDRGEDPEKVKAMMKEQTANLQTSNIIIQ